MSEQIKLRRCPFCGSLVTIESNQYYGSYYIRCKGCNVQTPSNSDRKIIAKLWNRRAGEHHD